MLGYYWGKSLHDNDDGVIRSHPLAYHSLDVAAVGHEYIAMNGLPGPLFGVDSLTMKKVAVYLLGLHDLGKFTYFFQLKNKSVCHESIKTLKPYHFLNSSHDVDGRVIFENYHERYSMLWKLYIAVCYHHGKPHNWSKKNDPKTDVHYDRKVVGQFVREWQDIIDFPGNIDLSHEDIEAIRWWLSGFSVLCDWIGSNEKAGWFPYRQWDGSLASYWNSAREKARYALDYLQIKTKSPITYSSVETFLPENSIPSHLQKSIDNIEISEEPMLAIIEDVTGSGKTEAALALAARMIHAGRGTGLFYALPTTATSDAMYGRVKKLKQHLLESPNVLLAHSKSGLYSLMSSDAVDNNDQQVVSNKVYDDSAEKEMPRWFSGDNRKALLADIGVGTIDQALLSILKVRHQCLRMFGLLNKVLILDEVHSLDTYMEKQLCTLLEFHVRLGGSAIILSATLKNDLKEKLLNIYNQETGKYLELKGLPYPIIQTASKKKICNYPIAQTNESEKIFSINCIHNIEESVSLAIEKAKEGCRVAIIKNTVDSARKTYLQIKDAFENCDLLHSHFTFGDRARIEKHVMNNFGSYSKRGGVGKILVSTQIIEQSLDLDFDVMISDLSYIDILIQRAGRLWRNKGAQRPASASSILQVIAPPIDNPTEDMFGILLPYTTLIYPDKKLLYNTLRILSNEKKFTLPNDTRHLIENVVAGTDHDSVFIESSLKETANQFSQQATADHITLSFSDNWLDRGWENDDECNPVTRLGTNQFSVLLGIVDSKSNNILPMHPHGNQYVAWSLSEIKIAVSKVAEDIHWDYDIINNPDQYNIMNSNSLLILAKYKKLVLGTWVNDSLYQSLSGGISYHKDTGWIVGKAI